MDDESEVMRMRINDSNDKNSSSGDPEIEYLMMLTVEELEEILEYYRIGQST